MGKDEVRFSVVHEDGSVTDTRVISRDAILACPFVILAAEHYRDDGSCRCDDAEHREFMKAEWEYTDADFDGIPLREGEQ